ncbi:hypothetical protein PVK06_039932 [Gossypium arboreum]|uniref:Uncharacterized protein n=1 Tax=Gossypium arboreum TaxID=29729 RepID=A0ABR0N4U5_GOSAR|nr:hypothetical protein PVK06_039932 [Gossypium arboreum]
MVQMHIGSGSLFLKLYMEFVRKEEGPRASTYVPVREARTKEKPRVQRYGCLELGVNGSEIALFFEPKSVSTEPEDEGLNGEGSDKDAEENP